MLAKGLGTDDKNAVMSSVAEIDDYELSLRLAFAVFFCLGNSKQ